MEKTKDVNLDIISPDELERFKEEVLQETLACGGIRIKDNVHVEVFSSEPIPRQFDSPKLANFTKKGRGEKGERLSMIRNIDSPFPQKKLLREEWNSRSLMECYRGVNETVAIVPVDKETFDQKDSIRTEAREGVGRVLDIIYKKKIPYKREYTVKIEPLRLEEVAERSSNEPVYLLQYHLAVEDIRLIKRFGGRRNHPNYFLNISIFLPKSLAEKIYKIIRNSPEWVREIVLRYMAKERTTYGKEIFFSFKDYTGNVTHYSYDSDVLSDDNGTEGTLKAWLDKKNGPSKLYINEFGTLDAEYDPEHVKKIL